MYSKLSMSDVPPVVLSHIISLAGFQSRLVLQKVSWNLRNFLEDRHFESNLKSISITVTLDFISIYIDPQNDWSLDIEYQNEPNGCSVQNGMKPKVFLKNQYFVTIFLNDLIINLKNQKSVLELFRLSFECVLAGFLKGISEVLDNRDSPLRVEELNLEVTNQEEVMSVLPYIDSKSIRKLFISSSQNCLSLEIDQMVRLDQWKSAKELEIFNCIISAPLKDFSHFSNAKIQIEMVCSEDLLMLKEAFLSSSSFQKFILKYKYFDENVDLQLLFGEPDLIDRDTWSFPYPDSDESLRLVHYDNRVFDFSKVKNSEILIENFHNYCEVK
ncbi:hypothetical protein L3Y34_009242 [Caenorhabditis briggsae]|uniref:DUF38 domain-containing protein n=1 Tax=Caenorhabditis briggsae TaxID=6238 RepID=A0AAE9ABJ9_CAEBR|nr:hypothetical protein L3Y34_009242 [Caenorhabditis briggsae]